MSTPVRLAPDFHCGNFAEFVAFTAWLGVVKWLETFQVSIVAYYYQSAKCARWDVTSSIKAWNVGYISVYSNLSSYASGSTKTCMEKFVWILLLHHFQA